jgi:hypothetical protein
MRFVKYFLIFGAMTLITMCSPSSESDQPDNQSAQTGAIKWADYDTGLKQSADNGKYVMAYFWRDG